jgi:hypothetical protein
MSFDVFDKRTLILAGLALGFALSSETALAAPADAPVHISVSGISRGYTNADLRDLIERGVQAALADDHATQSSWSFSVQTAPGNRPQTQIAATLQSGNEHPVSGYFTSPNLGTAPTGQFVEEVREFAKRLLRRPTT